MGVPGFESIDYEQWHAQCEYEFENKLLKHISFTGLKMRIGTDTMSCLKPMKP